MQLKGQNLSMAYRFRNKYGQWMWIRTFAFALLNPHTNDLEYIVCTNTVGSSHSTDQQSTSQEVEVVAEAPSVQSKKDL